MQKTVLGLCSYSGDIRIELVPFLLEAAPFIDFVFVVHKPVDVSRNIMVDIAQRKKMNLIMVDSDAAPAPGSFMAIAEKIEQEVCVAGVPYCASGGQICVGNNSPSIRSVEHLNDWTEVDNLGTHCIGYNIQVFDEIDKPYFYYQFNADRTGFVGGAEDTIFHNRLSCPKYVHYGLWAGHIVDKRLEKPVSLSKDMLAILSNSCG